MSAADALTVIAGLFAWWLMWPCAVFGLLIAGFPVFMVFDFYRPRWKRWREKLAGRPRPWVEPTNIPPPPKGPLR